eukprot:759018-Hanusia_phi.AAC.1
MGVAEATAGRSGLGRAGGRRPQRLRLCVRVERSSTRAAVQGCSTSRGQQDGRRGGGASQGIRLPVKQGGVAVALQEEAIINVTKVNGKRGGERGGSERGGKRGGWKEGRAL